MTPQKSQDGTCRLGAWVRDNMQGIGTLTFVEPDGTFAALGHGISDIDTGKMLQLNGGELDLTQILSVIPGKAGVPGELQGVIHYEERPIAFILDFFLVGPIAKKKAFMIVNPQKDNPFMIVLAISVLSIIGMCPLMSLAATLLFKDAGNQMIAVWFQTTVFNFPMAFFWQLCFAGPIVRKVFGVIFREEQKEEVAFD